MNIKRSRSSCFYHWTYDVFLNFRGEDTRNGFTGYLYNALRQRGIRTFFDDEAIQRGEEISPSLFKAIEESRMAITVFSPNYASSAYCLDELVHILECIKRQGRLVWPVFYDVEPSQVRHQKGSFVEALARHEEKHGKEKVRKWRLALFEAANLAGWEIKQGSGYEYIYIERIIKDVSTKLNRIPLHVADYPVGLESRVLKVNSLLQVWNDEGVSVVGILGIGGIGKTTIARAVYNSICDKFEGLCFLSNVREISKTHGLSHLQETLLAEVVGEKDIKLGGDVNKGVSIIKHRLRRKKVLLVLDDVDKQQQLQAMAGNCDWFGCGSKVIITTRDKHLLAVHGIRRIYEVKKLNNEEALQLFSWNAFKQDVLDPNYLEISKRVLLYSVGLPLALEVIGSNFFGKGIDEWNSALDGYNKTIDTKIFDVLKFSYDALGCIEKEIFLDVACFFKGRDLEYIKEMLLAVRDIKSEYAIGVLIEKSLIKIECGCVEMHDLVQDMGKEIIRQESPKEPGGRSRLWFYKDILHVLQENTGTDKIEVLILDLPKGKEEVQWSGKAFRKMKNLKMLIMRNARFDSGPTHLPNSLRVLDWSHYPRKVLPFDFHPTNLIHLKLAESRYESLGSLFTKNMENLTIMDFRHCKFLTQVSDLSGVTNLQELYLDQCLNLIEIHDSVGFLSKLRVLSTQQCIKLRTLPRGIKLPSLEQLKLSGCSSLQSFPEVLDKMEKITEILLEKTEIEELPYSIQNLPGLQVLNLTECKRLKQLPTTLYKLPNLVYLTTFLCSEFRHFSECEDEKGGVHLRESSVVELDFYDCNLSDESLSICLFWFCNVTELNLSFNSITILPACIKECYYLRELYVGNCKQLRLIEEMPPNLEIFNAENCISLTSLSSSKLLNQAFCEPGIREFLLPGEEVPKWFHHYTDGHLTEFWVRKRFPALDVCIVFSDLDDEGFPLEFLLLRVNDKVSTIVIDKDYVVSNLLVDHMFLYQLRRKLIEDELQKLLLPDHWNHVEVSGFKDRAIKSIGVHVYKQENTMDNNILFSRPFSLKRTCHDLYDSNNDMGLGCHPLIKKRVSSLGIKNNNISAWLSMCPSWQAHPLSYVNDGDSNSVALASTDDASMQTSSKKQPSKIETEIRLASFQPTIDPPGYIAVPVVEETREEVGLSDNQESFSPPNLETNEVTVNTSMDFEGITKMIEEDPMNAIERLLTGKVSVSLKMQQQSSTQLGLPEVQIPSFEALQKELKNLLTKFDLSSLISDDFHRSTICFYIEGLEKFEFLQPAHRTFIQNFRNFFINAASNYNKLNEVSNKKIRLKVERKVVLNKLQEARAKDERKTALISSASLRVKEIVSSIEDIEAQLVKLKHEKEAFELAINECGKQKERLRTDCISWAHQSRDLVVELTKTEEIAQFLEYQVETDETNFQKLVASIPF